MDVFIKHVQKDQEEWMQYSPVFTNPFYEMQSMISFTFRFEKILAINDIEREEIEFICKVYQPRVAVFVEHGMQT